jgi:RNA polymerase sigma-70 factor (ECF subfamily)
VGQSERVVESTYSRVRASVHCVAGQDSPDCVQEAYARAITSGVALDAEPWLKTVAKRVAIDKVRRRHEYASGAPVELEGLIHDHDGDPQEAFVRAERSAEVRQALEKLPQRYREVLMTYAEEDSPAAVASRLGLSASAAWTLLSRARSRLRLQLENVGYAPVAFLSRIRWRGVAIGGAAAGVAAAIAMSPLVPHGGSVQNKPPAPSAIVQSANTAADKATSHVVAPLPKVSGLPKLPVSAPNVTVPTLPSTPPMKDVATACIGTPKLPIAGVKVSVPQHSLVGALTKKLPPLTVGSKLCQ